MQTNTMNMNEGKEPLSEHDLTGTDHGPSGSDDVEGQTLHGTATTGCELTLTGSNFSKGASEHSAFELPAKTGQRTDEPDTSPLRVSFTAQYTDFGMEQLYSELAALNTDLERMRHIKRCLLDIVRCDFKRAPLALPALGDCDRESFKIHIRLSTRDTGLESLYQELKTVAIGFGRNNYLRRRLYDAFTASGAQPPKSSESGSLPLAPASASAYVQSLPATPQLPSQDAGAADRAADRREAIRKHNKSMFSNS